MVENKFWIAELLEWKIKTELPYLKQTKLLIVNISKWQQTEKHVLIN